MNSIWEVLDDNDDDKHYKPEELQAAPWHTPADQPWQPSGEECCQQGPAG